MKLVNLCFAWLVLLAVAFSAIAQERPEEGVHYQSIFPELATSTPDKVEVVELFWYACPHCFRFEPYLAKWLKDEKPAYVEFRRIPAILSNKWEPLARAYYAAEALGVVDKTHAPLFDAIHVDKRKLFNEAQLAGFFKTYGVKPADFKRAYHSFAVNTKVRQALDYTKKSGVAGVPSIIINGKYYTSGKQAGSFPAMIKIIKLLTEEEAAENKINTASSGN